MRISLEPQKAVTVYCERFLFFF